MARTQEALVALAEYKKVLEFRILKVLSCYIKEFELYLVSIGELLKDYEQNSDMTRLVIALGTVQKVDRWQGNKLKIHCFKPREK